MTQGARAVDPAHPSNFNQPPTLRCVHCDEVFEPPFSEFFWRDANGPFGWWKWCKACCSEAPSILRRSQAGRARLALSHVSGVGPSSETQPKGGA